MDDHRFDALTRTIAGEGWTRRRALQGVTSGALAVVLSRLGLEEASAACVKPGQRGCRGPKPKPCCPGAICKGGNKNRPGRCMCKPGRTKCGPTCVNTQTNAKHCGGCNTLCASGQPCAQGVCAGGGPGACPPGTNLCGTVCVNNQTSPQHCGVCYQACPAGHSCQDGTCRCAVGTCVSGLGCRTVDHVCNEGGQVLCGGPTRPSCVCITDVESTPRCADFTGPGVICQACNHNHECPAGHPVCVNASTSNCFCPNTGTLGTACARENCFGEE